MQVAFAPVSGTDWQVEIGRELLVKLTVPPVGVGLIVAVSVMGEPTAAGLGEELTTVAVPALVDPYSSALPIRCKLSPPP